MSSCQKFLSSETIILLVLLLISFLFVTPNISTSTNSLHARARTIDKAFPSWNFQFIQYEDDSDLDGFPDIISTFTSINETHFLIYINQTTEKSGYKWKVCIFNITNVDNIGKYEYNSATDVWTYTGLLNYGNLIYFGFPSEWCDNISDYGFMLFGSGSGDKTYMLNFTSHDKELLIKSGTDPETVFTSYGAPATRYSGQRKVFRNPRGLNYYYAAAMGSAVSEILLYKSLDGIDWILEKTWTNSLGGIAFTFYEDPINSQLVIYNTRSDAADQLLFQRGIIPDGSSNISWNTQQVILMGDVGILQQVIQIGTQSGQEYVFIVYDELYVAQGKTWVGIKVVATTTTFPGASPTWAEPFFLYEPNKEGGDDGSTGAGGSAISPFSATRDMFVSWGRVTSGAAAYHMMAVELDWNGIAFTIALKDTEDMGTRTETSNVVDSNNVGHVITRKKVLPLRYPAYHYKWIVGTGFDEYEEVGSRCWLYYYNLGIDLTSSPNILYAFWYNDVQEGKVFYKTTPVDTINWSDTVTIQDDSEDITYPSASYRDYDKKIQLIYTRYTSHDVRFVEVPLLIPPTDPPGIECQQYANISSYNATYVTYSLTIWVYNHMGSAQSVNVTPDSNWGSWYVIYSLSDNATNSSSFYRNFERQASTTNSTIQAASINYTQTQPCNSILIIIPMSSELMITEFRQRNMAAAVIGVLILVPFLLAILIILRRR